MEKYDVIIIGAGSGGIGASIAAARLGLRVLIIEKQDFVGGNAAQSGVSVWEFGVGGTGIPFEIYKRMKQIPKAVGIYSFYQHRKWQLAKDEIALAVHPVHIGADIRIDPAFKYKDTLRRHGSQTGISNEGFVRKYWHGVPFEPVIYQQIVEEMMAETGNITLLKNTVFTEVKHANGQVESLALSNGQTVTATTYIDSTDSGVFCRALGCAMLFGQESKKMFNEPNAPETVSEKINGVTLIYRVSRGIASMESVTPSVPQGCWWADDFPVASVVEYPNGDLNINMLPTMEGIEFNQFADYETAYQECNRRVWAHWQHVQNTYPPYRSYRISWIAPALGVREGSRVVGEYILKEQDIRAGLSRQVQKDIITIADHALDTHGKTTGRAGCAELEEPYGVPYRCLVPKQFQNVLIASRAASFSSLAASSCRLSRTMMQLGQAAGTAACLAKTMNVSVAEVSYPELRQLLLEQHIQLDYPMPEALEKYLENE